MPARSSRHQRDHAPRRQPVQERSKETFAAILQAAAQVLVREGHGKTTTNKIAERAGISVGTLYHYFPDKTSIFEALTEHFVTHLTSSILLWRQKALEERAARGDAGSLEDVQSRARLLLSVTIDLVRKDELLARALLDEIPAARRSKIMHAMEERIFNALSMFRDPLLERFRQRDPKRYEAAISLWLTMAGTAIYRIALDTPKGAEEDLLVDMLVRSFMSFLE